MADTEAPLTGIEEIQNALTEAGLVVDDIRPSETDPSVVLTIFRVRRGFSRDDAVAMLRRTPGLRSLRAYQGGRLAVVWQPGP